ncbi:MAG: DUF4296 domain-containing protein [Bacteroidales bacterium]|jgi:hypothetical protein|nr:DUF4296 domain-containing protein [Bacteroidales bacterium]
MKRVLTVFFLLVVFCSCVKAGKRISSDDFRVVLREMFLADLILERDGTLSRLADSTLVYPPILEKYGYTTEQFLATMEYYAGRPARFKSLLTRVRRTLNEERTEYNQRLTWLNEQKALVERFNNWLNDTVSGRHDFVAKQSLKRILPADPSDKQTWRMDRDSSYAVPSGKLLAVIDTLQVRDSVPLYLSAPRSFRPRINISLKPE